MLPELSQHLKLPISGSDRTEASEEGNEARGRAGKSQGALEGGRLTQGRR